MRDVIKASKRQSVKVSKRAKLAIEIFIYRIKKYIGAYLAAMGGLDAVVFTAGIGENCPLIVEKISGDLKRVMPADTKFMVIPTNEELLIARDTVDIVKKC